MQYFKRNYVFDLNNLAGIPLTVVLLTVIKGDKKLYVFKKIFKKKVVCVKFKKCFTLITFITS